MSDLTWQQVLILLCLGTIITWLVTEWRAKR